jgi:hypothetical protein
MIESLHDDMNAEKKNINQVYTRVIQENHVRERERKL